MAVRASSSDQSFSRRLVSKQTFTPAASAMSIAASTVSRAVAEIA